ncbi:replication initiation protein, partial [Acinetobacter sp. HR7]|uniref:replication initiation protein n=1 Tax=Acinetobacter sp. HR7 TaxID=1509403 RepID=UPI000557D8DE
MINKHQFKADFYEKLPHKPYCSWGKGERTLIRSKSHAIRFPLIQINSPHLINYLIFDIDAPDAYLHFLDANLPTPSWIAKNPKNGHCHICYALKTPVCKTENARMKPLRYLASIEYSYAKKLGADLRYTGVLTKNPLDADWQTTFLSPLEYELAELADFIDLETKPKANEVSGLGRNCMMFDTVRYWAYKAIRAHLSGGYDLWYAEVLKVAINSNEAFLDPLGYSEVKATA